MSRIAREARAVGTVPVALDTNPFVTGEDHGRGVVLAPDPDGIVREIRSLLDDCERLEVLSKEAEATAREQTAWEPFIERVSEAMSATAHHPASEALDRLGVENHSREHAMTEELRTVNHRLTAAEQRSSELECGPQPGGRSGTGCVTTPRRAGRRPGANDGGARPCPGQVGPGRGGADCVPSPPGGAPRRPVAPRLRVAHDPALNPGPPAPITRTSPSRSGPRAGAAVSTALTAVSASDPDHPSAARRTARARFTAAPPTRTGTPAWAARMAAMVSASCWSRPPTVARSARR